VPDFNSAFIGQLFRLFQSLVLFWISYNLMKEERVIKGGLWALAGSTIILAILQLIGVTTDVVGHDDRVTSFGDNPGIIGIVFSLGLLALFGIGYGREKADFKGRILFWLGSGIFGIAIVQTGSRGVILALAGSLAIFFLRGRSLGAKLKFGVIGLAGIILLAVASYQLDVVRKRWERTFYDEDLAGRQQIYAATLNMIFESPLIGWGPVNHNWELGPRVGKAYRDEHNLYLWLLAEGGVLGAIPFFAGLWLCWRAAWKARHGSQGVLPIAMLVFVLVTNLNHTIHNRKFFWLVLSYALASGYMVQSQRLRVLLLSNPGSGVLRRRREVAKISRRTGSPGSTQPTIQFPRT
jgi:O-antigen ligase